MKHKFTIYAMGQDSLTVELDGVRPIELKCIASHLKHFFDTDIDVLALNQSLTLFEKNCATRLDELHSFLETLEIEEALTPKRWELPVHYNGHDLEALAEKLKKTPEDLIELHQSHTYTIEGFGFLPGFFYIGSLPKALQIPRKSTPTLRVPKRSVAIAGTQTGIYPIESSGGWYVLGELAFDLFDPDVQPPVFVDVGDEVRFKAISSDEFELLRAQHLKGAQLQERLLCSK
jgi:KipI family sensor histidine kinase inhibitor